MGNSNSSYGLCGHVLNALEGNVQQERVSPAPYESLEQLTLPLAMRWSITSAQTSEHKAQGSTACSGETLYERLPQLRKRVNKGLPSVAY